MVDVQRNGQSIVTTSATTAPAAGTSETWAVTALAAGIRTLAAGETYALVDANAGALPSQQAEIIRVTAATAGATSITVTRGCDGTAPVVHAASTTFNIVVVAGSVLSSPLPFYAQPATNYNLKNTFEPHRSVYNLRPENTMHLRVGLERAGQGGMAELVVIGTSLEAASYNVAAVFDHTLPWSRMMQDALVHYGLPKCGTGLVRFVDGSFIVNAFWTNSGGSNWVASNGTFGYTVTAGAWATFTPDMSGDRCSVYYFNSGSAGDSFTVSVNGASSGPGFTTVTGSGSSTWAKVQLNAPILPGQTVKITHVSGTTYVAGACVWNSSGGLLVHNIAQTGSRARGGAATGSWEAVGSTELSYVYANPQITAATLYPYPDCVFIALGCNDIAGATGTYAQIYASIANTAARYPNGDIILIADTPLNNTVVLDTDWQTFVGGLYTLADTLNVPLIDLRAHLGTSIDIYNNLLAGDGTGHLNAKGASSVGRNIANVLRAVAPPTAPVGTWQPSDNSLLAANFPPRQIQAEAVPSAGFYLSTRLRVPAGTPITNVWLYCTTAGATLTYGAVGIYEADGTQSGVTGSQTATWTSTGAKQMALGTPVAARAVDRYVWATIAVAGTTLPKFGVASNILSGSVGMSGALAAGYVAGATPLPASMSMAMTAWYEYWVGLS